MPKPSKPVPARPATKRPALKTPITKEAVQRVQSRTAVENGGQQEKWTGRLQSIADRRATEVPTGGQIPGAGGAAGQKAGKASGGKKAA